MLYELPEKMQRNAGWKDRRYSPIVNPNLNRSVDEEFLAREQLKAEREGMGQVALFASQHFNIEVGLDPAGIGELIDALAAIDVTQDGKQVIGARKATR